MWPVIVRALASAVLESHGFGHPSDVSLALSGLPPWFSLVASVMDLPDAYGICPVHADHRCFTIVAVFDPQGRAWRFFRYTASSTAWHLQSYPLTVCLPLLQQTRLKTTDLLQFTWGPSLTFLAPFQQSKRSTMQLTRSPRRGRSPLYRRLNFGGKRVSHAWKVRTSRSQFLGSPPVPS